MPGVSALVNATFANAQSYAAAAMANVASFSNALNQAIYTPPTISVSWAAISAPTLPSLPAQPTMPTVAFVEPSAPGALVIAEPSLSVDTFSEVAPTTSFPVAPSISYGTVPSIPEVAEIAVPSAPTLVLPAAPTYLTLDTPTFGGVDLNEAFLDNLDTIPTLNLVAPTPYSYALGPEYASSLLSALQTTLGARMNGGTGLNANVEAAIWNRGRDRETQVWLANQAEVSRGAEALGFHFPPGAIAGQLEVAQQTYFGKMSDLSRDVSIKQADLEQENLRQTITETMQLESRLIDYSLQLERIAFESAREYAGNAIAIYNSQVEKYKALLDAYRTYAAAYDAIVKGQMAKVDAFRAQVAAEQAKADVNRTLVDQYKAGIEAGLAQVEIYRAQVAAAQTLVTIEQAKVSAAGERIRAYVAQINAETSKVEAYKAAVAAEGTKVDVYKVKADVFAAKVGAQAKVAEANTARFEALTRAKTAEWDGYKARVDGEKARIDALGRQSETLLAAYRAAAAAIEASANMHTRIWEGQIKNYEAGQQIAIQAAKINGDSVAAANAARLDAAKAGAQVHSQVAAAALTMIKAQAGISGSDSTGVSYVYQNKGPETPPVLTG